MSHVPLGPGQEFDRIRGIIRALGGAAAELGDDCALLPLGDRTLALSIDATIEDVHFRRRWLSPDAIGWRATAAALSDLAAVGADPVGVLVAVAVPASDAALAESIMTGAGALCTRAGTRVLGGDLTRGSGVAVTVAVIGTAARPVRRRGARPGDGVWVTGSLGGARAAVVQWEAGRPPDQAAVDRFARPEPRLALGRWLAALGATAMIDVSDGLAGDARHLAAASGVRLVIDLERLPVGPGVAAAASDEAPAVFAARGGEDYELLCTLPAGVDGREAPGPLTRIGTVEPGHGVALRFDGELLELAGFDHFA